MAVQIYVRIEWDVARAFIAFAIIRSRLFCSNTTESTVEPIHEINAKKRILRAFAACKQTDCM